MKDFSKIAAELRAQVSGGAVDALDPSYKSGWRVWNSAVTQPPAVVALCESTADVQAAVNIARRHRLPLSVRGGGHDWAGRAVRPHGVVIDLTRMKQVMVDPESRVAGVEGGAKLRDLAAATDAHGLLAAIGNCGAVGVAGLTTVGGYGPLNGMYGLAADNLLEAEMVLADGRCVIASPDQDADLFWAIRGGGGNFGVLTSMRIRLHQVQRLLAGPVVYAWPEAANVLRNHAVSSAAAPDELGIPVSTISGPDGQPALLILPLWNGDKHGGEQIIGELQALGASPISQVGPMRYSEMLAQFDASVDAVGALHWEARTRSLPAPLTAEAIDVIVAAISHKTSPYSMVNWHHFHGASTRVPSDATAFGLRSEHFMMEIFAGWKPDEDGAEHKKWAQELWEKLARYALPESYAAYLARSHREKAQHAYGNNDGAVLSYGG